MAGFKVIYDGVRTGGIREGGSWSFRTDGSRTSDVRGERRRSCVSPAASGRTRPICDVITEPGASNVAIMEVAPAVPSIVGSFVEFGDALAQMGSVNLRTPSPLRRCLSFIHRCRSLHVPHSWCCSEHRGTSVGRRMHEHAVGDGPAAGDGGRSRD